ncbi:MAG: PP2C family protein-serine/threonine phosphatase, partial [Gemmatimonadota bacterium]
LYTISEILGSILSLERAAERMLAEVADVLAARRASLWVHHPDDGRLHLTAAVGEKGLTGPIPVDEPSSVTAWVFRERRALNLERGSELPPGIRMDLRPRRREAFLSVPIDYTSPEGTGQTVGVVTLVGRRGDASFDAGDARLLTAIASQVGAAIEIHRLFRESLARDRMVHELELAHDLQLKLLPDTERFDGIGDVAARCVPAESVGGDFYHLFRLGRRRLGVMIGDVSSHGFSAALIMAMAMSAASIYAPETRSPAELLRRVHQTLIDELERTEMYMSVFYGVLDADGGELVHSNAGHPHAFRVGADGAADRLCATNPPLGTVPLEAYDETSVAWRSGADLLCLFTDGLSDYFADGVRAGEARILDEVGRMRERAPAAILDRIFAMTGRAAPGAPPDDRTAVVVRL